MTNSQQHPRQKVQDDRYSAEEHSKKAPSQPNTPPAGSHYTGHSDQGINHSRAANTTKTVPGEKNAQNHPGNPLTGMNNEPVGERSGNSDVSEKP